jgi:dihydrofolate reductase
MRKIIVSNLVSLDGYLSGPNGEIDWFIDIADKEFENYAVNLMNSVDTMLFGRVTYQLMESYWPTASPETEDPRIIAAMNNYSKVVFSNSLGQVYWKNSTLLPGGPVEEAAKLKQQQGKDMVVYGSGKLVSALTKAGLIDDYRIFVAPTILGKGNSMFEGIHDQLNLKLVDSHQFKNTGLCLLHYIKAS